ncbi:MULTISPECIES: N-acetylmuramoyl-L-alanine amidase [Pseudomonas]|uniref:N-acetylmuramoyl-L-alanine amidase n=1 Tax=Pseudomonas frederiksbergensis TaxID=104087 RepID=A0A6L5C1G8_9PSED|nr:MULTISPECIES: N-acetylmuramoyl-L-alanine amidase [Pseudomonas]KAF2394659.1 Zinc D-Ala-D-Ala carboxypeptidase [Pseudomonas frederiksbergensis]UZE14679.1 N-acetylmuramoyl-L-alanine amidase [Pseudomonas sp. B21-053]
MSYSLIWLPDVLQSAGLKVALVDGWRDRGRGEMGGIDGVICHHTAGARRGNMPTLATLINGRNDLPGPLSQLGLGRDGTFYVIAAGRCNHAGKGEWKGITTGNTNFIGIEAENTGLSDDANWPAVQVDSYQRGVAAILKQVGRSADFCAGHKEYAPHRKSDPTLDMAAFRSAVSAIMNGVTPMPTLIPAVETAPQDGLAMARPTLRRGAIGDLVRQIQSKCAIAADGYFGPQTEAALRELQRTHGLVPDGIVGPKTWKVLDQI